jgi:hypothetical protein
MTSDNRPLGDVMDNVMYCLSLESDWAKLCSSHEVICLVVYIVYPVHTLSGFNLIASTTYWCLVSAGTSFLNMTCFSRIGQRSFCTWMTLPPSTSAPARVRQGTKWDRISENDHKIAQKWPLWLSKKWNLSHFFSHSLMMSGWVALTYFSSRYCTLSWSISQRKLLSKKLWGLQ